MEERNYMYDTDLFKLTESLGEFKKYEDAKKLLDDFISANVGREYNVLFDDDSKVIKPPVTYCNSNDPQVFKNNVINDLLSHLEYLDIIDEESDNEEIYNRDYLKSLGYLRNLPKIITAFRMMRRERNKIKRYIDFWSKEAVPEILSTNSVRLQPQQDAIEVIGKVFVLLVKNKFINEDARETWNYVCGLSNKVPTKKIKFRGTNVEFAALLEKFFVSEYYPTYFDYDKNAANMEFVIGFFSNKSGKPMNYDSVKAQKNLNFDKLEDIWRKMTDKTIPIKRRLDI